MDRITILGAGTWGMALARMLANKGEEITVWSTFPQELQAMKQTHTHPHLPGMTIPSSVRFDPEISSACAKANMIVFATPSVYIRSTARVAAPYIHDGQIIISVAKGLENDSLLTMTQVLAQEIKVKASFVALSGPTHAEEVAQDLPTTIVSAGTDERAASAVQAAFSTECMRVYTNTDVLGVELCGAVKNIMAIAAGISAGLGYGDNAKAALITRGIAEISRLGMCLGSPLQTFAGLAGIGDLIVTATSVHSRNNQAGFLIGQGYSAEEAKEKIGMVVEGLNALDATVALAQKHHVEMPLVNAVYEIVHHGADPKAVVNGLMSREKKAEFTAKP